MVYGKLSGFAQVRERQSRRQQRENLPIEYWRPSVEDDLDDFERNMNALGSRMDTMNKIMFGLLVSLTTASIVGTLNFIVFSR